MKRIFNWTFGSIFRTFGRIIAYLSVGLLLGFILSKTGLKLPDLLPIMRVSAKEFSTTEQYRVYKCDSHNDYEGCDFTSWTNNGTATSNTPSSKVVRGYSMNFAQNETLSQGGLYRVSIDFKTTPKASNNQTLEGYSCFGVNSNSTSGGLNENIQSCELQTIIPTSDGVRYIFNVTPSVNIKSIKINIYLNTGYGAKSITGLNSSTLSNDTSTSDAINNQTNELLDNQNQNTQEIINNQKELLGSQCENIFNPILSSATTHRGITFTPVKNSDTNRVVKIWIKGTRTSGSNAYVNVMSNINLKKGTKIKVWGDNKVALQIYYASNSQVIKNVYNEYTLTEDLNGINFDVYTTEDNITKTIEFKAMVSETTTTWCEYGSTISKIDETNNSINDLKDSINDDDSSGAQSEASDFFSNFTTNTHGLTGIITAPLNAIQSLTSKSCSPLVLPLPFVNQNLTLPCMRDIYVQNFGAFMNIYDVITLGIISYWIMVRIFALVKDFKNPNHDEIEVMDL